MDHSTERNKENRDEEWTAGNIYVVKYLCLVPLVVTF